MKMNTITIAYGTDIARLTYDVLAASDIGTYLAPGMKVAVKPNLVNASPASDGATTHPEVVEGIIIFLKEYGLGDIRIIESSQVGASTKRAYKNCGYDDLSRKYDVPLVDLKTGRCTPKKFDDFKINVYDEALETDFLVNVPVLKGHSQTKMTCCMKNLKGLIPDSEKRRFHTLGIDKPVAALNTIIKPGYNVVDGICGDLSFEEGGSPVAAGRIIAGRNPLLVDSWCAELIGYSFDEIEYLTYGERIGIGERYTKDTKIVELNVGDKPAFESRSSRTADRYRDLIEEKAACSACYAALIYALHRLGGRTSAQGRIHIGQGFRGESGPGIGIGACTKGYECNVQGCPPKATDIISALK